MKLRTLPDKLDLRGKRVLVRVDWNIPLGGALAADETVKIKQSLSTIRLLLQRGASVVVLTHLGRPEGRDPKLSTKHLVPLLKQRFNLMIRFHPESVSDPAARERLVERLDGSQPRTVHLLENVRFEAGEEKNEAKLAQAYAALGDIFINDAFASSHRAHASVVGIAKYLPAYAGFNLAEEVRHLSIFLGKPEHPFLVIIGGLKLSTKIPVLKALLPHCDKMLVGGAMATTFEAAIGKPVGLSFVEKDMLPIAKRLARNPKVTLPLDVVVANAHEDLDSARTVSADAIPKDASVVDIGPKTMAAWAKPIAEAKTILWNGPVGKVETAAFGAGSRFVARTIAARAKGRAFAAVGGGDTLPVVYKTKTQNAFDHVSMGGGALLEFLAKKGKLPGLVPFIQK